LCVLSFDNECGVVFGRGHLFINNDDGCGGNDDDDNDDDDDDDGILAGVTSNGRCIQIRPSFLLSLLVSVDEMELIIMDGDDR
jgi:hypothetical protein